MPAAHIHNALVEWLALRPGIPGRERRHRK
jgi:hypothetical protein